MKLDISMPNESNATDTGAMQKVMDSDESKMSKKQIVGMVILCLVALAGVLFGIYGMNSQNEQIAQLTTRVEDAEEKVTKLETNKVKITDSDGGTTIITDLNDDASKVGDSVSMRQNPVVRSSDSDEEYSFTLNSTVDNELDANNIFVRIKEGDVTECTVGHREYTGTGAGYTVSKIDNCDITGLNGKVYKVIGFWAGQMKTNENIGFIMQDGTVQYFDFNNAVSNNDYSVKTAKIDGFVVDAFDVGVGPTESSVGGYVTTVFILSDGSIVKYSEAML